MGEGHFAIGLHGCHEVHNTQVDNYLGKCEESDHVQSNHGGAEEQKGTTKTPIE